MTSKKAGTVTNSKKNRSAVTNGTTLFGSDIDHRSSTARRMRDLIEDYTTQVGGDPSPALMTLIRNASTLSALLEQSQAKIVNGDEIDDELFLKRCALLSRLLGQIGLKRLAKDITPKASGIELDAHAAAIREASRA